MFRKIFFLNLLVCVPLLAQTPLDSTKWYSAWQTKIEHLNSVDSLESLLAKAEKEFAQHPIRLLRIEYLYSRYYNDVLTRNLQTTRDSKEKALLMARYGYARKLWEKRILKFAQTAARVDSIPEPDLALWAKQNKKAAEQIVFLRRLKEQGAPDLKFSTMDGRTYHFNDFKGHFVLLFFWNRHSVPCLDELSYLIKAHQMFPQKLRIIGIYISFLQDPMEKAILQNLIKEKRLNWPQVFGPEAEQLRARFFVKTYPTNLLFDPNLRLLNDPLDMRGRLQAETLISTLKQYMTEQ